MEIANKASGSQSLLRGLVNKYMRDHKLNSIQLADRVGVPLTAVDYFLGNTRMLPAEDDTWKLFRAITRITRGIESCIKDEIRTRPVNLAMGRMSDRSRV